jgi:hypothetical protein
VTGPTYQRSRRPTITYAMTRPGICQQSPRCAPNRLPLLPADPRGATGLGTKKGAAAHSATSTNNLAPGQTPSTLTPPREATRRTPRLLDVITKPLTPRHCTGNGSSPSARRTSGNTWSSKRWSGSWPSAGIRPAGRRASVDSLMSELLAAWRTGHQEIEKIIIRVPWTRWVSCSDSRGLGPLNRILSLTRCATLRCVRR